MKNNFQLLVCGNLPRFSVVNSQRFAFLGIDKDYHAQAQAEQQKGEKTMEQTSKLLQSKLENISDKEYKSNPNIVAEKAADARKELMENFNDARNAADPKKFFNEQPGSKVNKYFAALDAAYDKQLARINALESEFEARRLELFKAIETISKSNALREVLRVNTEQNLKALENITQLDPKNTSDKDLKNFDTTLESIQLSQGILVGRLKELGDFVTSFEGYKYVNEMMAVLAAKSMARENFSKSVEEVNNVQKRYEEAKNHLGLVKERTQLNTKVIARSTPPEERFKAKQQLDALDVRIAAMQGKQDGAMARMGENEGDVEKPQKRG